ncbi:hypothetical protein CYMTET_18352 [Cymbomonas tetramitiformis]|uniref:Uncharacterized protein n=1 Tax=Cymbomonas tetramitiformis TaxID=36881 RepID=A0AAE0G8I9_9CHLO|nr:hypothetical protein CYMTET_18352 [Cymbomonas tetramitiformis]
MNRKEPFTRLQRELFVYPDTLTNSKRKHIYIEVELKDDDLHAAASASSTGLPVWHTSASSVMSAAPIAQGTEEDGSGGLARTSYTHLSGPFKPAKWREELKCSLPLRLTKEHHLVMKVVSLDGGISGGSSSSMNWSPSLSMCTGPSSAPQGIQGASLVGYAVLPLCAESMQQLLADGEYTLSISKVLLPKYLQEDVKEHMPYAEEKLKVRLRAASTAHPAERNMASFYHAYDKFMSSHHGSSGDVLITALDALSKTTEASVLQHAPTCFSLLLRLLGSAERAEVKDAAFCALVQLASRAQASFGGDLMERCSFLVQYCDQSFDDSRPGWTKTALYPQLCEKMVNVLKSTSSESRKDETLAVAWWLLELVARSITLEHEGAPTPGYGVVERGTSGPVASPDVSASQSLRRGSAAHIRRMSSETAILSDKKRRLLDSHLSTICELFQLLLAEVLANGKRGLSLERRINSALAFFCSDLLSVLDPSQVHTLVGIYLDGAFSSAVHVEFKQTFLRIICDWDQLLDPLAVAPGGNYMVEMLLKSSTEGLGSSIPTARPLALRTLTSLLTKHEFDARYQGPEGMAHVASQYFMLIPDLAAVMTKKGGLRDMTDEAQRELLICVLFILRHHPAPKVVGWMSADGEKMESLRLRILVRNILCESLKQFALPEQLALQGSAAKAKTQMAPPVPFAATGGNDAAAGRTALERLALSHRGAMQAQGMTLREQRASVTKQIQNRRSQSDDASAHQSTSSGKMRRKESIEKIRVKLHGWDERLSTTVSLTCLDFTERMLTQIGQGLLKSTGSAGELHLDVLLPLLLGFAKRPQPNVVWRFLRPFLVSFLFKWKLELFMPGRFWFLEEMAVHLLQLGCSNSPWAVDGQHLLQDAAMDILNAMVQCCLFKYKHTTPLLAIFTVAMFRVLKKNPGAGSDGALKKTLQSLAAEWEEASDEANSGGAALTAEEILKQQSSRSQLTNKLLDIEDAAVKVYNASTSSSGVTDAQLLVDVQHSLCMAYAHVPEVHVKSLNELLKLHERFSHFAEGAQVAVYSASIITRILKETMAEDMAWCEHDLLNLSIICPTITYWSLPDLVDSQYLGYGIKGLGEEAAAAQIWEAIRLFEAGSMPMWATHLYKLLLPMLEVSSRWTDLSKVHVGLSDVYRRLAEQTTAGVDHINGGAIFFRVAFHGVAFGEEAGKQYIYREPVGTSLGDMLARMRVCCGERVGEDNLRIVRESEDVIPEALSSSVAYLQVTAVEASSKLRQAHREGSRMRSGSKGQIEGLGMCEFHFDAPFTAEGGRRGTRAGQWRRRTVLSVDPRCSFPTIKNRSLVTNKHNMDSSPVEMAIEMLQEQGDKIKAEISRKEPTLQALSRVLQGTLQVQVNQGIPDLYVFFKPPAMFPSEQLQALVDMLVLFQETCSQGVSLHARLITSQEAPLHHVLVEGLRNLREGIAEAVKESQSLTSEAHMEAPLSPPPIYRSAHLPESHPTESSMTELEDDSVIMQTGENTPMSRMRYPDSEVASDISEEGQEDGQQEGQAEGHVKEVDNNGEGTQDTKS